MSYANAAAFRAALEARLNDAARQGGRPVGRARKLVAFGRLLARLERSTPHHWVLKGGFALELRLPGQARARPATSTSNGRPRSPRRPRR